MRRDDFTMSLDLGSELIIDNFAGGGGTSTGLERAFGRPVDIAINHDPEALAMHAINHPHTKHLCESVWDVDPIEVTGNQPVGLVWLSPDCKHFSKAKGGKPVEKRIRGLAWVTLRWAAKCKPRVIMLENVEEFKTWGPLLVAADGTSKPDPAKRGKTFDSFVRQLRAHGYTVDHRELRASDHDTPTIRKRFFLVARRDGLPIRWPDATHGAPTSPAVLAGKLLPHRTAAECIDWSIPCPSIFERKRPLADATMRRIAKGIMRYVVDSAAPFIVGQGGPIYGGKPVSAAQPFGTLTTENHRAVVVPSIVPVTHQGGDRSESINEPFRTITGAQRGEKALAVAELAPFVMTNTTGHAGASADTPVPTITSAGNQALAAATLVQVGYGEREGQAPRALDIEKPLGTVVGGASKHALVTAFLNEHANSSNQRVMPADEPLRTICAQVKGGHFSMVAASLVGVGGRAGDSRPRGADEPMATIAAKADTAIATAFLAKHYTGVVGSDLDAPIGTVTSCDHHSLVTAHITKFRTGSTGSELSEPLPTITAGPKDNPAGAPHALGLVTAHIQRDMGKSIGHAVDAPLGTVTAGGGGKSALVASSLVKLRGTSTATSMDEPLHTISAGGQHHAEVRSFLLAYYGTDQAQQLGDPLATVTSRDRFGLVTIQGQDYQIVDIGLRMLAPHELYRAQGFPAGYIIDEIPDPALLFVDGQQTTSDPLALPRVPLTKSAQVRMCGNSVCPPLSEALIRANFTHEREIARAA
ncbi:DNA cytosine methyltransferase [Janthinobacterium lividum]|uniref:DNA cytosine methyltransferase n=1 Tax=Janthinobacterium lividum TaxID=29581 RepID=UPI00140924A1|nr:DNA cytosine methyltransferase [Janthinobacterium lividum]NHQ93333.1 DNA cytosine methyltransferase [Janthinobacterium lividum]